MERQALELVSHQPHPPRHHHLRVVMERYGLSTKTEAVDLALRHLAGQPMSREEALGMRGAHAIGEIPDDAGPRGAAA